MLYVICVGPEHPDSTTIESYIDDIKSDLLKLKWHMHRDLSVTELKGVGRIYQQWSGFDKEIPMVRGANLQTKSYIGMQHGQMSLLLYHK